MLKFSVIGNLGADAKVETYQGRKFVSFNVAENYRWTDEQGNEHSTTQWVSCALNGDGGKLLQFLTKGRPVFVEGRGSVRCYSSPKERRWVGAANISVDRIELLPTSTDAVPRNLYTTDGELIEVQKAFYIQPEKAKSLGATKLQPVTLLDSSSKEYQVFATGFIVVPEKPAAQNTEAAQNGDNNG